MWVPSELETDVVPIKMQIEVVLYKHGCIWLA